MPSACWRNAGLGYFLWVLADSLVCCLPLLGYFVLWGFGRLRALSAKDLAVTSRVPVIASGAGMLVGFAFHVAVATLFDVSEESRPGGSPFLAYLPVLVGWMAFVQSRFVPPAA